MSLKELKIGVKMWRLWIVTVIVCFLLLLFSLPCVADTSTVEVSVRVNPTLEIDEDGVIRCNYSVRVQRDGDTITYYPL